MHPLNPVMPTTDHATFLLPSSPPCPPLCLLIPPHSWRSTPAPAAASGDRFANYSRPASSSRPAAAASSGSAGAKLGAGDLGHLRIDDLRDLVAKTGAQLPREPTKDGVISALIAKGVSLNDMTRGKWYLYTTCCDVSRVNLSCTNTSLQCWLPALSKHTCTCTSYHKMA